MKTVVIVSPSLKLGGIERALTVLANYFVTQNVRVLFISCIKGKHLYKLDKRIEIIEPPFYRHGGFKNKLFFYPKLVIFLRTKIISHCPDAVLSFGDIFNPLVILSLWKSKIPVFISDRTSPDYSFKFPIPQLKKLLYPSAAGFIAQTRRAANYRQKEFGPKFKIAVIPNALRKFELPETINRQNTILYVGRFAWEKAPDKLIRAFAEIPGKEDWKLKMAGTGPLLNEMKELAGKLGVSKRVVFLGQVEEVEILYAEASIYVLPSVLEGFPNALCEAMAAGLPCICFDSIPYEDILEQNLEGCVVEDGNLTALTSHLGYLMQTPEERMRLGSNAKKRMKALEVDVIGNKYLHLILSENNEQII